MSTAGGPRITSDNLVLCLDAHDAKSYPGQPVTNLCYSGSGLYQYLAQSYDWDNSGAATRDRDVRNIRKPKAANNPLFNERYIRICSCVCTTAGSQHFGMGYTTSVSASTQYMVSMYYRQNKSGIGGPYIRGATSNANHGSLKWIGRDGKQDISGSGNWPVNEWIRLKCYATTNSNETGLYISNYIGSAVGDKIWSFGPQIETGSKFSPLVRQTRSTTDAWKDRTGGISNLIFNGGIVAGASNLRKGHVIEPVSNAYIDFDGTDDYIRGAEPTGQVGSTTAKTYEYWFKMNSGFGNGVLIMQSTDTNSYNWQYVYVHSNGSLQFHYGPTDAGGYNLYGGTSAGTITADVWTCIAISIDVSRATATDRVQIYKNAEAVAVTWNGTYTNKNAFYDGTDMRLYIGAWNHANPPSPSTFLDGQMGRVSIWKTGLTAQQVKANYNAQRWRYAV